ncbi:MAG: hypothetical protein HQL53_08655 [Magnetococcales bacterium]|nr:hypothetical protein [Magnetococcales bacterium]
MIRNFRRIGVGWLLVAALFLTFGVTTPVQAGKFNKEIALTLDVTGRALLVSQFDGFKDTSTLKRAVNLFPGQQIEIGPRSKVVVMRLEDFRKLTIKGPNTLLVGKKGLQLKKGRLPGVAGRTQNNPTILTALGKGRVGGIRLRNFGSKRQAVKLKHPSAGAVIMQSTPHFQWQAVRGVTSFRIKVQDSRGRTVMDETTTKKQIAWSGRQKLTPGESYSWQVTAEKGGKSLPSAKQSFKLLSPQQHQELEALKPAKRAPIADQVLYGVLLEKMGMAQASKAHWRQMSKTYPRDKFFRGKAR